MVTASYAVPQSSLVTMLKELAKARQMNRQLRKGVYQTLSKQGPAPQPTATKTDCYPKNNDTKISAIGRKTVQFALNK